MNKFYIYSVLIHTLILGGVFKVNDLQRDNLKFVEKKTMTVSLKNRKATVSQNRAVETSDESKNDAVEEKKIVVEPPQKEEREPKKEIKKLEIPKKKIERKEKKVVKHTQSKQVQVKKENTEKKYSEFEDKNRFLVGEDGVFTAINLDGIEYEILKEIDPKYPIKARKIGYNGKGEVVVEFLVDLKGNIKNIKFISGETKYGFKEEVFKALEQWKFKPIEYKGKKIKVSFEKTFIFK